MILYTLKWLKAYLYKKISQKIDVEFEIFEWSLHILSWFIFNCKKKACFYLIQSIHWLAESFYDCFINKVMIEENYTKEPIQYTNNIYLKLFKSVGGKNVKHHFGKLTKKKW